MLDVNLRMGMWMLFFQRDVGLPSWGFTGLLTAGRLKKRTAIKVTCDLGLGPILWRYMSNRYRDWIDLSEVRNRLRAHMTVLMNLLVP
jgi:hypothetical protein